MGGGPPIQCKASWQIQDLSTSSLLCIWDHPYTQIGPNVVLRKRLCPLRCTSDSRFKNISIIQKQKPSLYQISTRSTNTSRVATTIGFTCTILMFGALGHYFWVTWNHTTNKYQVVRVMEQLFSFHFLFSDIRTSENTGHRFLATWHHMLINHRVVRVKCSNAWHRNVRFFINHG